MDSLRLIYFRPRNPSWIWIRYVRHAFHKHLKNLLCRSERHFALDTLAPISPLVHINGDNAYSPQLPDTQNYTVTLNTSLTSNNTLPSQHPAKPFRLKHPTSLTTTSVEAPRTNRLKAANKNFRCCMLLKNSFVICCLKKYSAKQITLSPTAISLTWMSFDSYVSLPNLYKMTLYQIWLRGKSNKSKYKGLF